MPTDLLLELTHEAADSSRRKARYVKAFTADLEAGGAGSDRKAFELRLRELLTQTRRLVTDDGRMWKSLLDDLPNKPCSHARLVLDVAIEMFTASLDLNTAVVGILALCPREGVAVDEGVVRELADAASQTRAAKAEAERLLAALGQPWPPVDAARLAQGRRDAAEGRAMKPDELIAAVRAARK